MKIQPQEIGFDFDGVIANTADTFIRLACTNYNYCSFTLDHITNFELEHCIDMPGDLVNQIFLDILEDSLGTGLQPMHGATEVLDELAAHSPITVITARHLEQPVIDWFDQHCSSDTTKQIKLVAMGDHDNKLDYIQQHNLKYFVDDRAETCNKLAISEITPLVFSHPWNRDRHNLPMVESWQEIRLLLDLE